MTKQYIYSLYDAKTGALRAKGTPQELMEQGYYNRAESVCTGYAHQKKKKAKPKKSRPPITGIEKPDELQRDVHELCLYNAAARKAGKKELSYGYWAAAGKPEAPA